MPAHGSTLRYQLAPFGSPEKLVIVLWLLLLIPFCISVDHFPTNEDAAKNVVRTLNKNGTRNDCQLCLLVLENLDLVQSSYLDASAKDFETFLGQTDERLLTTCKVDPNERGCDTLRVKIEQELTAYTNVVVEQMITVTPAIDHYGSSLVRFLDRVAPLIRQFVAANKVTSSPPPSALVLNRRLSQRAVDHLWLTEYPTSKLPHRFCAPLCEKSVGIVARMRLYFWRYYFQFRVHDVIEWLQQEHLSTFLVLSVLVALTTVVLRCVLVPLPLTSSPYGLPQGWGFRVAVEGGGNGGLPSGSATAGSTGHGAVRVTAKPKSTARRR